MKKIDSLNLVPFIDIMLVLLVIVLVSASFSVALSNGGMNSESVFSIHV